MKFKFLKNGEKNFEYPCNSPADVCQMLNDLKTWTISSAVHSLEYEDLCLRYSFVSFRYDINTSKYVCLCCSLHFPSPVLTSFTYEESIKFIPHLFYLYELIENGDKANRIVC